MDRHKRQRRYCQNFSVAISCVVKLNCIPLCMACECDGTVVGCLLLFGYYWYPVTVAVLVASTMFLPVCKRTEHTGLFLGHVVLDGISYRKYHSIFWNDLEDFDHIFCTILVLCFVCWFLNDRRFSVAGSFSIVSRTSVICAIT